MKYLTWKMADKRDVVAVVFYLGGGALTKKNQWPQRAPSLQREPHQASSVQPSAPNPEQVDKRSQKSFIDEMLRCMLGILDSQFAK